MTRGNPSPAERLAALKAAVLTGSGALAPAQRAAICEGARKLALDPAAELGLDEPLASLVRDVVTQPAQADVTRWLVEGRSDDEIFEIVIAAALGSALSRADAGLTALGAGE